MCRSDQTSGSLFSPFWLYDARVFRVLISDCCFARITLLFCTSYFPPRFASRKSTFFLTIHSSVSSGTSRTPSEFQAYSPTGSYLSMLSGRWVRGRRKVMKKPVRAIDMRRTATVLDFAVREFSSLLLFDCAHWPYLSSPLCGCELTMRQRRPDLDSGGRGRVGGRQAAGGVADISALGMDIDHVVSTSFPSTTCTFILTFTKYILRESWRNVYGDL